MKLFRFVRGFSGLKITPLEHCDYNEAKMTPTLREDNGFVISLH